MTFVEVQFSEDEIKAADTKLRKELTPEELACLDSMLALVGIHERAAHNTGSQEGA